MEYPEQRYYEEVRLRLNQARAELDKAKKECRISDAAELIRKIKFLVPEETYAYNQWINS